VEKEGDIFYFDLKATLLDGGFWSFFIYRPLEDW